MKRNDLVVRTDGEFATCQVSNECQQKGIDEDQSS